MTPAASSGKRLCVGLVSVRVSVPSIHRYLPASESSSGQRFTLRSSYRDEDQHTDLFYQFLVNDFFSEIQGKGKVR